MLNTDQQKELLKIARSTVENYVTTGKKPEVVEKDPALNQYACAFVTLKMLGNLRGCIGCFEADKPLYQVVQDMAISAATRDPRFRSVQKVELRLLNYEISVLSPLRQVKSADEIEIGKHGVQVARGFRSGVFLPQVATENNLTKEAFLNMLCREKAGLPEDCWKDPETKLYVFTAQVFSEKELAAKQKVQDGQQPKSGKKT